jgi:hypothetical protein
MLHGNISGPGFNHLGFDLLCFPPFPADEVVVVARRTSAKKIFTLQGERTSTALFRMVLSVR